MARGTAWRRKARIQLNRAPYPQYGLIAGLPMFPYKEEVGGSSPSTPTPGIPCGVWGFYRSALEPDPSLSGDCPSGVRLSFGAEAFEAFHGDFVDALVEVAVDVEHGACALVAEAVGDVAGRLSFADEHGDVGMAQVVGVQGWPTEASMAGGQFRRRKRL